MWLRRWFCLIWPWCFCSVSEKAQSLQQLRKEGPFALLGKQSTSSDGYFSKATICLELQPKVLLTSNPPIPSLIWLWWISRQTGNAIIGYNPQESKCIGRFTYDGKYFILYISFHQKLRSKWQQALLSRLPVSQHCIGTVAQRMSHCCVVFFSIHPHTCCSAMPRVMQWKGCTVGLTILPVDTGFVTWNNTLHVGVRQRFSWKISSSHQECEDTRYSRAWWSVGWQRTMTLGTSHCEVGKAAGTGHWSQAPLNHFLLPSQVQSWFHKTSIYFVKLAEELLLQLVLTVKMSCVICSRCYKNYCQRKNRVHKASGNGSVPLLLEIWFWASTQNGILGTMRKYCYEEEWKCVYAFVSFNWHFFRQL